MISTRDIVVQNRVLAAIDPENFNLLRPHLRLVPLKRRAILQDHNRRIDRVHFIERGVASLFARTQRDGPVEVAIVGRLGLVGVAAVLGTMRSPNRALMQVPGDALQIASQDLRRVMESSSAIRQQLLNYVHVLLVQNSQTELCNARHELGERLCRWLLLASERLDERFIPLTHDMLSMILGVRRAGVTEALASLEQAGVVKKARGVIEILNRVEMERQACECYRIIAAEYRRLTGPSCYEHVLECPAEEPERARD